MQRYSRLLHTLSVGRWSGGISILNACISLVRASDMFEAILSRLGLVPPLITESWLQPEIVSRSASCGPVLDLLDGLALLLVDCAPCGLRPGSINVCSCIPNEHRVNRRNKKFGIRAFKPWIVQPITQHCAAHRIDVQPIRPSSSCLGAVRPSPSRDVLLEVR